MARKAGEMVPRGVTKFGRRVLDQGGELVFRNDPNIEFTPPDEALPPPMATVELEGKTPDFLKRLRRECKMKNEAVEVTQALTRFAQEGGQELVEIFGAEHVADAVERVLSGKKVDHRTGLYMVVRHLEPDLAKRQKVYETMRTICDEEEEGYYDGLATRAGADEEARKTYHEAQGGECAATHEVMQVRKMRIAEFAAYDKAAFTLRGGIGRALGRALGGKVEEDTPKWALRMIGPSVSPTAFRRELARSGNNLAHYIGERSLRTLARERELHEAKERYIAKLAESLKGQADVIAAPFNEKIAALGVEINRLLSAKAVKIGLTEAVATPQMHARLHKLREGLIEDIEELERQRDEEVQRELAVASSQIAALQKLNVYARGR